MQVANKMCTKYQPHALNKSEIQLLLQKYIVCETGRKIFHKNIYTGIMVD